MLMLNFCQCYVPGLRTNNIFLHGYFSSAYFCFGVEDLIWLLGDRGMRGSPDQLSLPNSASGMMSFSNVQE
jgi:hypothetical protein